MSAPIGPGDWLICVNAASISGHQWLPGEQLTEGAVYQVADAWVDEEGDHVVALVGRERREASKVWGVRVGYWIERFRPIWRGDDSVKRSSSQPIREDA